MWDSVRLLYLLTYFTTPEQMLGLATQLEQGRGLLFAVLIESYLYSYTPAIYVYRLVYRT